MKVFHPAFRRWPITLTVLVSALGTSLVHAIPYNATVLADNPFAYYRFEESIGSTALNSGTGGVGLNGTYFGGYTLGQASLANLGSAVRFNGSNAYVAAPQSVGSSSFTVEGWINTTVNSLTGTYAFEGNGTIWSDVGGGANDWTVAILNNRLSVFTGDTNTGLSNVGPSLNDGQWHHIAATRQAGVATTLYVDGVSVGSFAAGTAPLTANSQLRIGANTLDGRYFNGMMDEVAIYQTALSGSQILSHYQAATATATVPASDSSAALVLTAALGLLYLRRRSEPNG